MPFSYKLALLGLVANMGFAQLTTDQKVQDFQHLASLFAKRYGPYEWKRDALGFDLLKVEPWLAKVRESKDDLAFYEVMSEYVSGLNDAHDAFFLPSSFVARLNFTVDVFDGKLLVDSINRTRLPASEYGFMIGYELVSIDGTDAQQLLDGLLRYWVAANPRSTRRSAALYLTSRPQSDLPHAGDVPEISTVVFRRPDDRLESHRIPWTRVGLQLTNVGRYFSPRTTELHIQPDEVYDPGPRDPQPEYLAVLNRLQNCRIPRNALVGLGALAPVWAASRPEGFVQRLGRLASDPFYSGVFESGGFKIGFIRIPSYSPSNAITALTAFQNEITFFQANTDGLVVDTMRNPGGNLAYANQILSLLIPSQWRSIPFEVRATSAWVADISSALEQVKALGAPQSIVDLYQAIKDAIIAANHAMRGRTSPIPLDDVVIDRDPAVDSNGNVIAYSKPLIVLIDEMSASAAELVAATIQDNGRGPLVGWRTMGAGGNVTSALAGSYSLGSVTLTESLMVRDKMILSTEYPPAPYIENIGVRPDIPIDYMTRGNLVQNGKPFVDAFVDAVVAHIRKGN